jgi:hypothetical protein
MNTTRQIYSKCAPYGIEYNPTTDVLTRIGDPTSHRVLPVQSGMVGVILDDLGNEVMEMPSDDWTSVARDGSLGQVMVPVPDFWVKFQVRPSENLRIWLSSNPITGFMHVPQFYVSAYEASLQRSTNKLCSVVNTTADYRGGNNQSAWDGTYRSQLGMPATSISLTNFRTYARNRNNGDTRWNCNVYDAHKWLFWLFAVEYCTFNSQAAFNANLGANGYHQGGLGDGVTTWDGTSWNNYNGYCPLIPCGTTDTLGNGTGVVPYTIKDSGGSDLKTFSVPCYRGIENPFGHIWKWTDGLLKGTNNTDIYTCSRPSLFASEITANYQLIGSHPTGEGYIGEIIFGSKGEIIAKKTGGSANSKFFDYLWNNNPTNTVHALLVGGSASFGAPSGLLTALVRFVPSHASADVGSRLCFIR